MPNQISTRELVPLILEGTRRLLEQPRMAFARIYWKAEDHRFQALGAGLAEAFSRGGAEHVHLQRVNQHRLPIQQMLERLDPDQGLVRVGTVPPPRVPPPGPAAGRLPGPGGVAVRGHGALGHGSGRAGPGL